MITRVAREPDRDRRGAGPTSRPAPSESAAGIGGCGYLDLRLRLAVVRRERLASLVPIGPELADPRGRERVMDHLLEDLERDRGDVRAGERRLGHVQRVPDRGREDLR